MLSFHIIWLTSPEPRPLCIGVPALVFRRFNLFAYLLLVLETDSAKSALVFDPQTVKPSGILSACIIY